jgi:nucleoside-diphosphate-sugar epimerase
MIAVIGGNGFIGKAFLELCRSNKENVRLLLRNGNSTEFQNHEIVVGTLKDNLAITTLTTDIDVLIHTGFDHTYLDNIEGIKNILECLKKNQVKRFIYLSSYVVYNQFGSGNLDETTLKSCIADIYTQEKLKIERLIVESKIKTELIILQPSIVYGIGGNWSNVFFKASKSRKIYLPKKGLGICNLIYVTDLTKAIWIASKVPSVKLNKRINFYLVSGYPVQWKEVYEQHSTMLKSLSKPIAQKNTIENAFKGKYGNSFVKNVIIYFLFLKILSPITSKVMKIIKRNETVEKKGFLELINDEVIKNEFTIEGLSKLLHSNEFYIDFRKIQQDFGFQPSVTLEEGIIDMKERLLRNNQQ